MDTLSLSQTKHDYTIGILVKGSELVSHEADYGGKEGRQALDEDLVCTQRYREYNVLFCPALHFLALVT